MTPVIVDVSENRGRLLLVEDEQDIADAMVEVLGLEGFEVLHARNGKEGLEVLRQVEVLPDAILLDLRMPTMDGWRFRAEQRKDRALAGIPVLVISADLSPQAQTIDAAAFLPKPLDSRTLTTEIRRVLSEARAKGEQEREAHRERLQALGQLAAGVAHEINNPLAWVAANLRLLKDRTRELAEVAGPALVRSRPDAAEFLQETFDLIDEAIEGSNRIRDIVQQVRSFSQPQSHEPAEVELLPVIEAALKMADLQARFRAQVDKQLEPVPWVMGDPTRLGQLFVNLLLNAADAAGEGRKAPGRVSLSTRTAPDGRAVVEIADDGPGIPDAIRTRIFEPFFTTKSAGRGTGLGLFVCHNIATSLGAEISLQPAPGGGTVARVVLPAAKSAEPAAPPRPERPASAGCRRILLVEDEAILARALQRLLSKHYEAVVCHSATEALTRLDEEGPFDVVLCDVHMPELGGPELYAKVKERWPKLAEKMLFMSGGAISESSQRFIEEMGERVLSKPVDLDRLQQAIQAM